jgi:hypothetical protein
MARFSDEKRGKVDLISILENSAFKLGFQSVR